MATHALRIWTGPLSVREIAKKLRDAGVHVSCEGTEFIYVTAEGADVAGAAHNVLVDLLRAHGSDLGLRPRRLP